MKILSNKLRAILIVITLILSILLINQMQYRNDELYAVNLKNKMDKSLVSILVSDESGNYNQYKSETFPSKEDYTYNSELSKCQDNNGNVIEGILRYNEESGKVSVRTKKTTYCYLYFDYVPHNIDASGANPPKLAGGMIPVYYDASDASWHKADINNSNEQYKWYDYDNKMWANAVTVTSTNRSTYQNAALGTKITDNDINTMFVWIPRYKYTVWNYNYSGSTTSNIQEIHITFESEKNKTGDITCITDATSMNVSNETCKINNATCTDASCNGKTYTHPAFTLGDDELTGFWVGKFEPTGTISALTIKPSLSSVRDQNVSSFFTNIINMKNTGNAYGFAESDDTHMIKNIEWGAVAYLYHSKYGVCTNGTCPATYINNSSDYKTGNSGGSTSASYASGIRNAYNTASGQKASTTGNIYGVYDMNGGADEYTMGNVMYTDGQTMITGFDESRNSGFSGMIRNAGTYSGIAYPAEKYYNIYSYYANYNNSKGSKLGDGIKEVYESSGQTWYNSYMTMVSSASPWFMRGGDSFDAAQSNIFRSGASAGNADNSVSTRIIISIP